MTKETIFALGAGVQLDGLVAENVLGWTRNRQSLSGWLDENRWGKDLPEFSVNMAAAWQVVTKMRDMGYRLYMVEFSDGVYVNFYLQQEGGASIINTPALVTQMPPGAEATAICRAALLAIL